MVTVVGAQKGSAVISLMKEKISESAHHLEEERLKE
jgi:hypothetical protein